MPKMTGAQLLADMLKGYGVSHVFMVPAVLRRTFAEMENRTAIQRIHTHGEKAAAYMADGYARASGRPGVCMAQVVGALNLAAGLRDAMATYVGHGRKVTGARRGRRSSTSSTNGYSAKEIRDWARDNGHKVPERGRIPATVREAFQAAH